MKMSFWGRFVGLSSAFLLCLYAWGCGSAGTDSSSSSTTSISKTAAPTDSLVSQPAASNISSSSSDENVASNASKIQKIQKFLGKVTKSFFKTAFALEDPVTFETHQDKKTILDNITNATTITGCFGDFPNAMRSFVSVNGFGPIVGYSAHPDGSPSSGTFPPFDTGIWNETSNINYKGSIKTQATVAAQTNKVMGDIETHADIAQRNAASTLCVGRINNKIGPTTPAVGETVDLTTDMTNALSTVGKSSDFMTLTSVTVKRLSDTSDGKKRYEISEVGRKTITGVATLTFRFTVRNVPLADDGSTYKGLIQHSVEVDRAGGFLGGGNCPSTGASTEVQSILYEKVSATEMRGQMKAANFCGLISTNTSFSPYSTATGEVDLSLIYNASTRPNGWGDNATWVTYNNDPLTNAGTYASCWQAGALDSHARCTDLTVSATGGLNGAAGGCGHYGFGTALTSATSPAITGMICNWSGPNNNHSTFLQPLVQRQCITYNSTTTLYDSIPADSVATAKQLKILYSPSNSCSSSSGFIFADTDSSSTATNDNTSGAARTNNLETMTSRNLSFTQPTAPSSTGILSADESTEL